MRIKRYADNEISSLASEKQGRSCGSLGRSSGSDRAFRDCVKVLVQCLRRTERLNSSGTHILNPEPRGVTQRMGGRKRGEQEVPRCVPPVHATPEGAGNASH